LHGLPVRRVRYASPANETLAYTGNMMQAVRSPSGLWAGWSLGRAFRRAAREEVRTADLIHAHWWIPGGLAAPPEVPLVLTVHGTDGAILGRSALAAAIARPLFRRAKVVTAVSEAAAETIHRATGRVVDAAHIQPMPVDTTRYGAPCQGGGGLVIVARLTKQKRIDLAIRALPLTARRDLRLRIAGDGPERSALEQLTSELGLGDRITFLGAVPPAEIPTFLSEADVAIFPAVGEGFGLAAAEALMAGVPVVACTDGGGVLSVVPPAGEGRQVAPEPQAIAAAIDALMRDGSSRTAAASAGQEWARTLSAENVAATCARWYEEALRG
jgi:glycosyltransferase involved in cell wall biosynthesis